MIQTRQVQLRRALAEQSVLFAQERIVSKLILVARHELFTANTARKAIVVVDFRLALHDQIVSVQVDSAAVAFNREQP